MSDAPLDTTILLALSGIVIAVLGVLGGHWGRGRSVGADVNDRGEAWRTSYGFARDGGYGVALLGVLLFVGALFARCVFDGGTP